MLSRYIRVPSVMLLLVAGIGARLFSESKGWQINFPEQLVELLGSVGLIMIVLEAGLDLETQQRQNKTHSQFFFCRDIYFRNFRCRHYCRTLLLAS